MATNDVSRPLSNSSLWADQVGPTPRIAVTSTGHSRPPVGATIAEQQVNARGRQLADGLRGLQKRHDSPVDVRALGLMVAAQFDTAARTSAIVQHRLHQSHLITMTAGAAGTTLRFMPPLTVSADEIDLALDALVEHG